MKLLKIIGGWLESAADWLGLKTSAIVLRWPKWFVLGVLLVLFVLFGLGRCSVARADTGLVMTSSTAAQAASATQRGWARPAAGRFVLSFPSVNSAGAAWGDAQLQFREWSSIPAGYGVAVCSSDIPAGAFTTDPCGDAAKPLIAKSAVVLTTPPAGTGTATCSWVAPTKNTDGTAYTDAQGFQVYFGTTNPPTAKLPQILSSATLSRTFTGLASGTYYCAAAAVNAGGIESGLSTVGSKTIAAPSPTVPLPPTGVKVVDATAYELVKGNDKLTAKAVGTIGLGAACKADQSALGLFVVPRASVTVPAGATKPTVLLAKCG